LNLFKFFLFVIFYIFVFDTFIFGIESNLNKKGSFNLIIENDKLSDTDRHYTNGLQLAYFLAPGKEKSWVKKVAHVMPLLDSAGSLRPGYFFGHEIYTPDNIKSTNLVSNQRPYAGWLYGGLSVSSNTQNHFDVWRLNLGVVGPSALGEEVQNNFHKLIGVDEAQGWEHQIKNKFGFMLTYERGWRHKIFGDHSKLPIGADIIPHLGITIGNVQQFINSGFTFRLGNDLKNDYGPPRIRPSLPGSEYFEMKDFFSWYAFAGLGGRYINYNVFVNNHDKYSITPNLWVLDSQFGLVLGIGKTRLTYTYVIRSKEFKQQISSDKFASLGLSYLF